MLAQPLSKAPELRQVLGSRRAEDGYVRDRPRRLGRDGPGRGEETATQRPDERPTARQMGLSRRGAQAKSCSAQAAYTLAAACRKWKPAPSATIASRSVSPMW